MINFKNSLLLRLALLSALVFMGCARPPEAERSAARAAMDAALSARAEKYVPADSAAARRLWETAENLVKEKKYEEAKRGYIDARAAFEKAAGGIEAAKTAAAEEVGVALPGLEEGWQDLQALFQRVEKKVTKGRGLWEADAKTFVEDLKTVKETFATDPGGAREKMGRMKSFLESYTALFQQLAAAPAKAGAGKKKAGYEGIDE